MDNKKWDKFIKDLDSEGFDKDLKEYLKAIKYVSEIKIKNIDDREKINSKLSIIVDFIEKYKEEYYEISLITGFKTNEKENDVWKINGRDYYYYIADQKMKASVYYIRYLNYIEKSFGESANAENSLKDEISKIQQLNYDSESLKDNVIDVINVCLEQENQEIEKIQEIQNKCLEYVIQIKAKNIDYLKYMLFNNMMREIYFLGAAFQYLWHWEVKTKNLFRYSNPNPEKDINQNNDLNCYNSKKEFFQDMFRKVIKHINTPKGSQCCSYSEDPYIDIFKYLKIPKTSKTAESVLYEDSDMTIYIDIKNENTAQFDIIKDAQINSVYSNCEPKSFYAFIQDEKNLNELEHIAYAVEIYPELKGEKNEKGTSKNIKNFLLTYLETWNEGDGQGISFFIADDKEVVTLGNIENSTVTVDKNNIPEKLCSGCKYTMKFNKEELIYLLLKLNEKIYNKNLDNIEYNLSMQWASDYYYPHDSWIERVRNESEKKSCKISGKIHVKIGENNFNFEINVNVEPSIIKQYEPSMSISSIRKDIDKKIKEKLQDGFKSRYNGILNDKQHLIGEFVFNFINREKYECPKYISKYNEYTPENDDEEISMLKHFIFKRS